MNRMKAHLSEMRLRSAFAFIGGSNDLVLKILQSLSIYLPSQSVASVKSVSLPNRIKSSRPGVASHMRL